MESEEKSFSSQRRNFLKGSAVIGAAGMLMGVTGCAPKVVAEETPIPEATVAAGASNSTPSFMVPPAAISESEIKNKKSAEIVIVGVGISGMLAGLAAVEAGSKVIMLEKHSTYISHGGGNGVVDSRAQKDGGINLPKDQIMAELMRFGNYHPNALLIQTYLRESGRVMDKLLDLADKNNIGYSLDTNVKEHFPYKEFPDAVLFTSGNMVGNAVIAPVIEKYLLDSGVEILYSTPGVQLIQSEPDGKVTGVIAKNEAGYLQVDAVKGVILCTGGYGSNPEMLGYYAPRALKAINNQYAEATNTGDGICMGLWVGGIHQDYACPMLWDGMIEGHGMFVGIARQPWLYLNLDGIRYANEDAPFGYTANQDIEQPGSQKWSIWDGKWMTDKDKLHGTVCENMSAWTQETYDEWKNKNVIIEADTIEGLVEKMGLPKETALASIKRYNEVVEKGVDEDFGKDPAKLTSIVQAPFGAAKVGTGILVTCDGLKINTSMQVLDADRKPISGLYAAGNDSGGFFAHDYPIDVIGVSLGRAVTFGWLAGENASKVA